jgi:hypothetical protein
MQRPAMSHLPHSHQLKGCHNHNLPCVLHCHTVTASHVKHTAKMCFSCANLQGYPLKVTSSKMVQHATSRTIHDEPQFLQGSSDFERLEATTISQLNPSSFVFMGLNDHSVTNHTQLMHWEKTLQMKSSWKDLRHTTNNMQCHIWMSLAQDSSHIQHMISVSSTWNKVCVLTILNILFVHS